jgi:hypothetical protein
MVPLPVVRWVRLSQTLPSLLHLTYPFLHLPLAQAGMARRTEQLRRGQQFGWGRGGRGAIFTHLCHLSGRLLCTARLGGNGGVTVSKGTETDTDTETCTRLRRVSSAGYWILRAFPFLLLSFSPSPRRLLLCFLFLSLHSTICIFTLTCITEQVYFLFCGVGVGEHKQTEEWKECEERGGGEPS